MADVPTIVMLAGPNGAGKSTVAPYLLQDVVGVPLYVNADMIAQGLAGFAPETATVAAGRIMLQRIRALAALRKSFAFETTLASKTYVNWLTDLLETGYRCHIIFLWLPSPELAVGRVAERVRQGGHAVAPDVVQRRYWAGLRNFHERYRPIATSWSVYDNETGMPLLVAEGSGTRCEVADAARWSQVLASTTHE